MAPRPKWVFVEKNKGEHSPVQKPDSAPRSHQHPIFYSMSLVSVHLHKKSMIRQVSRLLPRVHWLLECFSPLASLGVRFWNLYQFLYLCTTEHESSKGDALSLLAYLYSLRRVSEL